MADTLDPLQHAKSTLLERGIGIPYPQREVRLIGGSA
jgi:hypothetical protein